MTPSLGKINPKFRNLTDLLFFSDRMDLDLSEYKNLLRENHAEHKEYLWGRFQKSSEIFWEQGSQFWSHRLTFLFSLNENSLSTDMSAYIEKRMFNLVKMKYVIDVRYDIELQQFLEYCKVKTQRRESLQTVKDYLLSMPSHVSVEKLLQLINHFIPLLFKDVNEYTDHIAKKIPQSARNFELLRELEGHGLAFNKQPIMLLAKDLLLERTQNDKNRRALFSLLHDPSILSFLKTNSVSYKDRVISLLNACDYKEIEDRHLSNVKVLLELEPTLGDDLASIYAEKLYARGTGHKKANADKLIRLLKSFPQIQPKKVLAFLSAHNKMTDIKYMLSAFPDLKKLAAFV
jgi:hypothetical protein